MWETNRSNQRLISAPSPIGSLSAFRGEFRTTGERVDYNAPNGDVDLVFNVQMYPGWNVYLTPSARPRLFKSSPISIEPPFGRIKVTIPQGEHGLLLRFEDTLPRTVGTIITVVSLLIAIGLMVWDNRNRRVSASKSSSP